MPDHERGAYTPPTDAPLAFEARQPVRGARPFPLTLALSLIVLVGLAAAIFVFYRSGVRHAGPPEAVGTPLGAIKSPAPPDARPRDEAEGLQIYREENGEPPPAGPPTFTAPPDTPQPRPQLAQAPSPAAAPTTPIATSPAPALRPAQAAPAPAAVKPPARRAAEVKPRPAAPPPAAPKAEAKPAPAAAAGDASVQVGAVGSPQLADRTWNEAVAVAPGLAAGKGKGVEKVEVGGKTLYRTLVTGFAGRAEAQTFCGRLKAAGKACFVK